MGGANAPLTVEESAAGVCKLLTEINQSHNGGLYDYQGKQLPV